LAEENNGMTPEIPGPGIAQPEAPAPITDSPGVNNTPADAACAAQPSAATKTSPVAKAAAFLKSNKIVGIIAAVVALAVVLAVVLAVAIPSSIDKLLKAADAGLTDGLGVLAYLEETKDVYSSPRKSAKLEKALQKHADALFDEFQSGKVNYKFACSAMDSYDQLALEDSSTDKYIIKLREKLGALNASMEAYKDGLELEENEDTGGALLQYARVVDYDKSYKDAQSRIAKLSATFVTELKNLEAKKDYRNIVLRGYELSENRNVDEEARARIAAIVETAQAALKAAAKAELTIQAIERDTGGSVLMAFTEYSQLKSKDGTNAFAMGILAPEEETGCFAIKLFIYPGTYIHINKGLIGTTYDHITAGANFDTDYAGYNRYWTWNDKRMGDYKAEGTIGDFSWENAQKLYDILDGSEQTYLKVYSEYGNDSFTFSITDEFRAAILTLLDYKLSLLGEPPAAAEAT